MGKQGSEGECGSFVIILIAIRRGIGVGEACDLKIIFIS